MELMEITIGIMLAINFGSVIYAIYDITKSNFHKRGSANIGWIWIVILFQGPGSILYFLNKKK
jgi:hypothetical protein